MRSPAAFGSATGGMLRGGGNARSPGTSRASKASTPSRTLPTTEAPTGVHAATPGSSINWNSEAPSGTCGPVPST